MNALLLVVQLCAMLGLARAAAMARLLSLHKVITLHRSLLARPVHAPELLSCWGLGWLCFSSWSGTIRPQTSSGQTRRCPSRASSGCSPAHTRIVHQCVNGAELPSGNLSLPLTRTLTMPHSAQAAGSTITIR